MSDDLLILTNGREAPSRADAVQNRADILQSARSLFAEHGVEDVSMSQIARAADVGKGTLYRHFRSKAELCIALLDSEQRALQERTFTHLRNSRQTPLDNLTWFIREVAAFTENNMELLAETSIENQIDLDHPAHHWQWMTIVGLLRLANAQGDLEYFADTIYAMLDARMYRFHRLARGYSPERIADGLVDTARRLIA